MKTPTPQSKSKVRLSAKGQLVSLRQCEDVPETRLEDLVGSTGYRGPSKSLEEMEAGVAEAARRSR